MGFKGPNPALLCRTAARPVRLAVPRTGPTAARPAAAAASRGRRDRDTATDKPSRSETGRGAGSGTALHFQQQAVSLHMLFFKIH